MRDEDRTQWFKVKAVFLQNCKETTCHYCSTPITNLNRSVDHKHPIAKGGGVFDLNNLALCCKFCNLLKTDHDYDYFVANRLRLLKELKEKQRLFRERQAENAKFTSLKESKDFSSCFSDEPFLIDDESESEIQKYRSNNLSLIKVFKDELVFNFAENFPLSQKTELKHKLRNLLTNLGCPIKTMKVYINHSLSHAVFDCGFLILVNFETGEESLFSKKNLAKLNDSDGVLG